MDFAAVQTAEEELLTSDTRRNPGRLLELLHPDFIEIGRSGRRWTRDEIINALAAEGQRAPTVTDEWTFIDLAPDVTLVTYVIRSMNGDSRHSSIWMSHEGRLRMRFHQGTPVTAQPGTSRHPAI